MRDHANFIPEARREVLRFVRCDGVIRQSTAIFPHSLPAKIHFQTTIDGESRISEVQQVPMHIELGATAMRTIKKGVPLWKILKDMPLICSKSHRDMRYHLHELDRSNCRQAHHDIFVLHRVRPGELLLSQKHSRHYRCRYHYSNGPCQISP